MANLNRLPLFIVFGVVFPLVGSPSPANPVESQLTDSKLCGPIALNLIFGYYGRDHRIENLLPKFDIKADGVSMEQLARCAEEEGFAIRADHLSDPALLKKLPDGTPIIIRIRGNHFAVVWHDGEELILADYPNDARAITPQELATTWDGNALIVSPDRLWDPYLVQRGRLGYGAAIIVGLGFMGVGLARARRSNRVPALPQAV